MSQVMLVQGEARQIPLRDTSVHCVITSPPYWCLRDYGIPGQLGQEPLHDCAGAFTGQPCGACYVCHIVQGFREAKRVLRDDGTFWLNLGDSYSGSGVHAASHANPGLSKAGMRSAAVATPIPHGLKPKDLCGIPWRVALALQADGWTLRSDIIWQKPNGMPSSVTDRPTTVHEYLFLFAKAPRYFYDQQAIAEPTAVGANGSSFVSAWDEATKPGLGRGPRAERSTRNARSVWAFPTEPTSFAHYATMPTALVERCIKAGTSAYGACVACGAPWARQVERHRVLDGHIPVSGAFSRPDEPFRLPANGKGHWRYSVQTTEHGWLPSCGCITDALSAGCRDTQRMDWLTTPAPCKVFDPFVGSGTVLLVARALGRHGVGMDLSYPYLHDQARIRLQLDALASWEGRNGHATTEDYTSLPLFGAR